MSEPMSSVEIEDVLSSIRRLVSEDLRPVAANGASPKPLAPAGKLLLLTPALRVVPSIPKPVVAQLPEELPATAAVSAQDWLPEAAATGEDEVWEQTDTHSVEGLEQTGLTRVVSEIGAAVVAGDEEWEPEVGDAPMASLTWRAPEWVEEAELVDAASDDEISAKALADAAEDEAVAEIMARAAQAKAEAAPESDHDQDDGGYFDEAVLRDLVRDLIREELGGTLGERITRNVRKLVRAEINRAMTARDFD